MVFILGAIADLVFATIKGIFIVCIGTIYAINEWINPH